jgi:murein DD-endopeptidase MepM/ murein hydrolase activator NlpD
MAISGIGRAARLLTSVFFIFAAPLSCFLVCTDAFAVAAAKSAPKPVTSPVKKRDVASAGKTPQKVVVAKKAAPRPAAKKVARAAVMRKVAPPKKVVAPQLERRLVHADGSGLSKNLIENFQHIYGKRPSPNERYSILFERYFDAGGQHVRDGRIVYAALKSGKGVNKVYLLKDEEGQYRYYTHSGKLLNTMRFTPPLRGDFPVTSKYGMRKHPITGKIRKHAGVDLGAPNGTKVYASADAKVEFAGYSKSFGNYVKLNHGGKYYTLYAHLKGFAGKLKVGQTVRCGQHIGYVGSTGMSTGNHLHYEIAEYGAGRTAQHTDPMRRLASGSEVFYHDMGEFKRSAGAFEAMAAGGRPTVNMGR